MENTVECACKKILRSASAREQSTKLMREKLIRDNFSPDVINEALERACRSQVIDDHRYSNMLIRSTLSQGKGLTFALKEIEELGVDVENLDSYKEYLEQGEECDESRALAFLNAHPPHAKNKHESAYRKLINKGYSSSVASTAARRFCEKAQRGLLGDNS